MALPQVGIILRLTHTGKAGDSLLIPDLGDGTDPDSYRKVGQVYVPRGAPPANPGYVDLTYSTDVAISYRQGAIGAFIDQGYLQADFLFGQTFVDGLRLGIPKEVVIHPDQLDTPNGTIDQGIPFYLDCQPVDGDTLILTDGATSEVFTFRMAPGAPFEIVIGATPDLSMNNVVIQVNADSTLWAATLALDLDSINDGSGGSTAGRVVVLRRANQTNPSFGDRIYGVFTTQTCAQYVNYAGERDYAKTTSSTLPTADPVEKQFGFGRTTADLIPNETHLTLEDDFLYTWDPDAGMWQLAGGGALAAGDGLYLFGGAYNVGANADGSITVNANDIQVGVLATDVQHGNRGGGALHSLATTGTAGFMSATDKTKLDAVARAKLQFTRDVAVPGSGTLYLASGFVVTSAVPIRMVRAGTFEGASISVNVADGARTYKLSIELDSGGGFAEVESLTLPSGTTSASTTGFSATYAAGDLVRVALVRTAGVGGSTFTNSSALLEVGDA